LTSNVLKFDPLINLFSKKKRLIKIKIFQIQKANCHKQDGKNSVEHLKHNNDLLRIINDRLNEAISSKIEENDIYDQEEEEEEDEAEEKSKRPFKRHLVQHSKQEFKDLMKRILNKRYQSYAFSGLQGLHKV
jgi:hypothetical protein